MNVINTISYACFQQQLVNVKKVESILEQLISSGAEPDDLCYEHYIEENCDVIRCTTVRVCLIRHEHVGCEIWPNIPLGLKTTYTFYPDGRPDGWPELT